MTVNRKIYTRPYISLVNTGLEQKLRKQVSCCTVKLKSTKFVKFAYKRSSYDNALELP